MMLEKKKDLKHTHENDEMLLLEKQNLGMSLFYFPKY